MSVQQCQRETTSTEFLEWQDFFAAELKWPDREHYYLAQIAAEVHRTIAKNPKSVNLEKFMISFRTPEDETVRELSEDEKEVYLANSKAAWLGMTGITKKNSRDKSAKG